MARGWGRVDVRPDGAGSRPAAAAPARAVLAVAATVAGGLALVLAGLAAPPVPAPPAGAHAQVVGSAPEDGETVEAAPTEVSVVFDAKPATVEGDPLQVVAPDGRRVDTADVRAEHGGRTLTVGLDHSRTLPSGDYQIAYRVVSADSHMITGRLSFSTRLPARGDGDGPEGERPELGTAWVPGATGAGGGDPGAGTGLAAARRVPPEDGPAPETRLRSGGRGDIRPRLVAASALVLAAAALVLAILRPPFRPRPAAPPARRGTAPPSGGHRTERPAARGRAPAATSSQQTTGWHPAPVPPAASHWTTGWIGSQRPRPEAATSGRGPNGPGHGPRQAPPVQDPPARVHSRRARARARRRRPRLGSSPVGAGLRLPPALPGVPGVPGVPAGDGAALTAPGEPPVPTLVTGHRRRPWSVGTSPPPALPPGPGTGRSRTALAPWSHHEPDRPPTTNPPPALPPGPGTDHRRTALAPWSHHEPDGRSWS